MIETPFVGRRKSGPPTGPLVAFASLLGVSLYLANIFAPFDFPSPVAPSKQKYGLLLLVFYAGLLALFLRGRRSDPTLFRFDHRGVFVPSHGSKIIPWSSVSDVHEWKSQHLDWLVLELDDPASYPAKGVMKRLPLEEETGGTVAIPVSMTDRSIAEVSAAIDYFRTWNAR